MKVCNWYSFEAWLNRIIERQHSRKFCRWSLRNERFWYREEKKTKQSKRSFLNKIFFIEICYFYSYIASISYRVYLKFMTIKNNYRNGLIKKEFSNLVVFSDEKYNISTLKKHISSSEHNFVKDLIKTMDLKKKILSFDISSKRKIILEKAAIFTGERTPSKSISKGIFRVIILPVSVICYCSLFTPSWNLTINKPLIFFLLWLSTFDLNL